MSEARRVFDATIAMLLQRFDEQVVALVARTTAAAAAAARALPLAAEPVPNTTAADQLPTLQPAAADAVSDVEAKRSTVLIAYSVSDGFAVQEAAPIVARLGQQLAVLNEYKFDMRADGERAVEPVAAPREAAMKLLFYAPGSTYRFSVDSLERFVAERAARHRPNVLVFLRARTAGSSAAAAVPAPSDAEDMARLGALCVKHDLVYAAMDFELRVAADATTTTRAVTFADSPLQPGFGNSQVVSGLRLRIADMLRAAVLASDFAFKSETAAALMQSFEKQWLATPSDNGSGSSSSSSSSSSSAAAAEAKERLARVMRARQLQSPDEVVWLCVERAPGTAVACLRIARSETEVLLLVLEATSLPRDRLQLLFGALYGAESRLRTECKADDVLVSLPAALLTDTGKSGFLGLLQKRGYRHAARATARAGGERLFRKNVQMGYADALV